MRKLRACALALCLCGGIGPVSSLNAQAPPQPSVEEPIRILIQSFADARNAHDGNRVAAFYSEDGEWMEQGYSAAVRGRLALAAMWSKVTGHVERTISSIEFITARIAVVKVTGEYDALTSAPGKHSEVFVLVNDPAITPPAWKIRVHETLR